MHCNKLQYGEVVHCMEKCNCPSWELKSVALSEWSADTAYDGVQNDDDDDDTAKGFSGVK